MHVLGCQLADGNQWEGGGSFCARFEWGQYRRDGRKVEGSGGIGPTTSGDDPWAVAAECARRAREMLARWRRDREACRYYAPLFNRRSA